jgi:large subunit ribosomal protein L25
MAKQVQLKAKTRNETGRGHVKRMRSAGSVPGVVYGAHTKPFNITVDRRELGLLLEHATGENLLVDLVVEDAKDQKNRLALIQEVQHHPVQDMILHVDFHEVLATEKLRTVVPVRSHGEPAGVKTGGGVLEYVMRELHVECLPKDLPDVIEVNVEAMEIGQSIHVRDIKAPEGVTLLDQKDMAVFIVVAPIAEEVAATPAEGAVEPEVITAKKEEGEEGEAPAAGKAEAKPKAEAGKAEAKPAAGAAAKPGADAKAGAAPKAGAAKPAGKK